MKPSVEQILAMADTATHLKDQYERTQMLYCLANLFERLNRSYSLIRPFVLSLSLSLLLFSLTSVFLLLLSLAAQRMEVGPAMVALCKAMADQPEKDLLYQMQMRPIARLVYHLGRQRTSFFFVHIHSLALAHVLP